MVRLSVSCDSENQQLRKIEYMVLSVICRVIPWHAQERLLSFGFQRSIEAMQNINVMWSLILSLARDAHSTELDHDVTY